MSQKPGQGEGPDSGERERAKMEAAGRETALLAGLLILLAPAVGSFLAVLADRLARGEDVVRARSACRSCGAGLGLTDLVPLLSFLWLRGRCRHCGAAIPPWLFYAEILATGAALLALLAGGGAATVLLSCLFLWLLLALALSDLLWLRLPDLLTGALCVLVLGRVWITPGAFGFVDGFSGLGWALIGAGLGCGSFLTLRIGYRALRGREGLGLGDVKLMAGLGGFAGPWDLPLLVLMGALLALLGALIASRAGGQDDAAPLRFRALPFGTALCAAGAALWLLRAAHLLGP
ncbi:MAG: prepilin peptidase [Pseudophaeobacter sp. bin_em_oilr2.035]|nr:prepilin peptidase [Pseudophaeobacter sp. bin_em_oilr2.035]